MHRHRIAAIVLAALAADVQTSALAADDCDLLAAKITASYGGATVDRRTEANIILFRHPAIGGFSLVCAKYSGENPAVSLSADTAYPSAAFWDAAGQLGTLVTGAPTKNIVAGDQRCQRSALKSSDELAELQATGLKFECQAFTRDGGGTAITVYKVAK
jgi:hypothetical protein